MPAERMSFGTDNDIVAFMKALQRYKDGMQMLQLGPVECSSAMEFCLATTIASLSRLHTLHIGLMPDIQTLPRVFSIPTLRSLWVHLQLRPAGGSALTLNFREDEHVFGRLIQRNPTIFKQYYELHLTDLNHMPMTADKAMQGAVIAFSDSVLEAFRQAQLLRSSTFDLAAVTNKALL